MTAERQKKEYDAFGPWVVQVRDTESVPYIYDDYFTFTEEVVFAVKIPRPIERRKARPGMHLYDYLLAVYDDSILLLERKGDTVITDRILYSDICCLKNSLNLLSGELIFFLETGSFTIPYNTVGEAVISEIVECIRRRYETATVSLEAADFDPMKVIDITLYRNLYVRITGDKKMKLLAFQPDVTVAKKEPSFLERLFRPNYRLCGSMIFTNDRELLIIRRIVPLKKRNDAGYGYSYTFLPFGRIEEIRITPNSMYIGDPRLDTVSIATKSREIDCYINSTEPLRNLAASFPPRAVLSV